MSPLPRHVGHRTFAVGNGNDSWPSVILASARTSTAALGATRPV